LQTTDSAVERAKRFDFDRGEDRSKPFFAIILSGPLRGIPDAEPF